MISQDIKELFLLRYLCAVDSGDLEEQANLLAEAKNSPILVDAIWETHLAYEEQHQTEERVVAAASQTFSAPLVRSLTGLNAENRQFAVELPVPPVTWRDVAVRLRSDAPTEMTQPAEHVIISRIADRLESLPGDEQVPTSLTQRDTRTLLTRVAQVGQGIGVSVVRFVQETLLAVAMEREGTFRLAAARRERLRNDKRPSGDKSGEK